jgi:16S rRNA (cytosine967-C5)-methyltransferase
LELSIPARIIAKSSRERPADAALRDELRASNGLSREEGAEISRAVFSYFRWRGWLEEKAAIDQQIRQAIELADEFRARPENFSDAELLERAVPSWLASEMELDAKWVRAIQREPRLWLRARKGQGRALAAQLGGCRPYGDGILADALEYDGTEDLFRTPEFQSGAFEIQDLGSQAVGWICAPRPGETWWDACAGEGGKLLHLSDLMENRGLIWATDRVEWRLKKLQRRTARAKVFNYRTRNWDGGPKLPVKTRFDGALVDAPCSGIGTWQRNPHARWTTKPSDVRELAEVQKELLAKVAPSVKQGGKLVYAVCTLTRAETVEVVEEFGARFPDFSPLEITNPLASEPVSAGKVLLRTEDTGGNGMFVAAWARK